MSKEQIIETKIADEIFNVTCPNRTVTLEQLGKDYPETARRYSTAAKNTFNIIRRAGYTLPSTDKGNSVRELDWQKKVRNIITNARKSKLVLSDDDATQIISLFPKPSTANSVADKLRASSRLKLEADSRLRKISWFQDKWLSFDDKDRYFILDQILSLISPPGVLSDSAGTNLTEHTQ